MNKSFAQKVNELVILADLIAKMIRNLGGRWIYLPTKIINKSVSDQTMKHLLIWLLSLFLLSGCADTQDEFAPAIKQAQEEIKKIHSTSQGSIVLMSGNNLHFLSAGNNVSAQSQFYVGSLTKQMTAYMMLQALQAIYPRTDLGTLLSNRIIDLFPHSTLLTAIDRPWVNQITLLDLMTHRSGLSDYIDYYQFVLKNPAALNEPIDPIQLIQSATFDASQPYRYSNTNYLILGKLIEEIRHTSFDQLFDAMIKVPAGMTYSFAPIQLNYLALKSKPQFQNLVPDLEQEIFIDMSNALGTGNVISTASDLLKWNQYLFNTENYKVTQVMLKRYFQDEDGGWVNLGLGTEQTRFGSLIGFQGGLDSYHSFLAYLPERQLNIIVLSNNQEDFDALMQVLAHFLDG